jgi:hypothetical protein
MLGAMGTGACVIMTPPLTALFAGRSFVAERFRRPLALRFFPLALAFFFITSLLLC